MLIIQPLSAQSTELFDHAASTQNSRDGVVKLSWNSPGDSRVQLSLLSELSDSKESSNVLYTGTDTATVLTGLSDGRYTYQLMVLGAASTESEIHRDLLTVEVKHHSLSRAFMFFALGAVVFISTVILVVSGYRAEQQECST